MAVGLPAWAQEATPHARFQAEFESGQTSSLARTALSAPDPSSTAPLLSLQDAALPRPCKTIFGYLPYWESAANIRWNLLTHIACFSVEVNSNGNITNHRGWPGSWTSTINAAHQNGVKVILCTTLFNDSAIATLMGNATYKNNFFVNMKNQILAGNADGLNVDFEGTGSWRNTFHTFLSELNTYLKSQIPGCEVTFAGPAIPTGLNTTAVAAACDGIFIMGYAFAGSWSSTSGANAPLSSITSVVDSSSRWGPVTTTTPQKLILGLPYYGHHWTTETSAPRSTKISFIGSTRFRNDATDAYLPGRELLWDTVSQTPWYRWHDGTDWHQVWYDDAASLGLKYDLADTRGLQGVGMWALNYDGTRPELWDELDRRYGWGCVPLPDFDDDRDIDQIDFGRFQACMTPSSTPPPLPECERARLDGDEDVDADDYLIFERCMSGPNVQASPSCLSQ